MGTQQTTSDAVQSQPVLLVQNDWTSQLVLAHIAGHVLEEADYAVEFIPFDSQLQFRALADGAVHFQIAAWQGPMHEAFNDAKRNGMVDAGTHTATTREGWWIPEYVLEDCPDAANWRGLNDCAQLFATDNSNPAGLFIGPPADWGKDYAHRIEALQMNFHLTNVDSAAELWSRLQAAHEKRQPIVLFNWTPNFTDMTYDGLFVDFPEPSAACDTDPGWGPNPNAVGDCGDRRSSWLKKAAWGRLEQLNPAAWAILTNINFTNEQIARAIQLVDIEGLSPEDAARLWAEEHASIIEQWLDRQ